MKKLLALALANASAHRFTAAAQDGAVTMHMYGIFDADYGLSASALAAAMPTPDTPINIFLDSPGGDVFEARAMAALIARHAAPVTVTIDGIAASAATYFALSAAKVNITDGSMFMIHNAWTWAFGNKHDLIKLADTLAKVDTTIAADYVRKTGASTEQVTAWMDAETWFTAQEALDAKFADALSPTAQGKIADSAKWNLSAYANAPKPKAAPTPPSTEEIDSMIAAQRNRNIARAALLEFDR